MLSGRSAFGLSSLTSWSLGRWAPAPYAARVARVESDELIRAVGKAAFVLLAGIVTVSYAALLWRQLNYGLEYDESYLLVVIRNIASGGGYVDDGVSFFTTGEPFHPYISTGPTLLLPSALVWKITGGSLMATRLVPLAFFVVYLAATAGLFHQWRGRWAALAAVAAPLMLPVLLPDLTNRSLMPGRFVGEIAATAFLLVAALFLLRRNYGLAGLAAGLAILTKFNFVVPVLVLLVVWGAYRWVAGERAWRGPALRLLPGVVLPSVIFELYKLFSLGFSGYAHNITLVRHFGELQSAPLSEFPNSTLAKLAGLMPLLSGPAIVLCCAALGVLVLTTLLDPHLRSIRGEATGSRTDAAAALVAVGTASVSLLLWWSLTSRQTSPRPAVPVVMLALSFILATMVVVAFAMHARSDGRLRTLMQAVPVVVVGLLLVSTAFQGAKIARNTTGHTLLVHQQEAADVIARETGELPVDDFWTNPELSVLADLPFQQGTRDDPSLLVYTSIRALIDRGRADALVFQDECGTILYSSTDVLVCRKPSTG